MSKILALGLAAVGLLIGFLVWLVAVVLSVGVPTGIVLFILDYVKIINIW